MDSNRRNLKILRNIERMIKVPFRKINVQEEIEKKLKENPEFAKAYKELQEKLSKMTKEEQMEYWRRME